MLIVAHRGFSARHPENSAAAFEAAIAAGADYIETDVRLTRDGVAVCWHDPDLRRLAGREDEIAALGHDELNEALAVAGRTVLTLDAVLGIARDRCRVMLDVKVKSEEMVRAVAAALHAREMTSHALFGMRDPAQHAALQRIAPGLAVLAMPSDPEALPEFLRIGVTAARLWEHEATPDRIARIRSVHRSVWVTAGLKHDGEAPGEITDTRLTTLRALMVNAVLVNDPEHAVAVAAAGDTERDWRRVS